MSDARICPECGSDIYRASHYEELMEARDRHWRKNQTQALKILELQLRVAELEDERRTRGRKVEMQRRTIVRLQKKLELMGVRPHEDKSLGEADPVSPSPKHELLPGQSVHHDKAKFYASPRGLRKMKKRLKGGKK